VTFGPHVGIARVGGIPVAKGVNSPE